MSEIFSSFSKYILKTIVFLLFIVTGCSTMEIKTLNTENSLKHEQVVYIAKPQDGIYNYRVYQYSGNDTQNAIENVLYKYVTKIIMAETVEDREQAILSSKKHKADILVFPKILDWEDHATQWSGLQDKIRIRMEIVNVADEKQLDNSEIYHTNSSWQFTNQPIKNLLPEMLENYFSHFYNKE